MSKNNIEEIFKERLNSFSIEPSTSSWIKVNSKLRVKSFLRFNFKTINIYNISIAATIISAFFIFNKDISKSKNNIDNTKKIIVEEKYNTNDVSLIEEVDSEALLQSELPVSEKNTLSAVFTASETKGCAPLEVTFINLAEASTYLWDFGDGVTSNLRVPYHLFKKPGKYNVSLKLTDTNKKSYFHNQTIMVFSPPEALFTINTEESDFDNKQVVFSNDSRNAVSFNWMFGDEESNSIKNTEHIYKELGEYNVVLVAINKQGCVDTAETKIGFLVDNCRIEFPTVFSPSIKSNVAEKKLFLPSYKGVEQYHLTISNQFGSIVFETNEIKESWDGYYKGAILPSGMYSWNVEGKFINGKDFNNQGSIRLLVKNQEDFNQY